MNVNRSVLIVTPYFAPQSHAAVFRAYKLAKYLPRLGWKPYVLTADLNYLYNEDPCLLPELPDEVEIIRVHYVEPTLRGLRMMFGGRDRTFRSIKAQKQESIGSLPELSILPQSKLHKLYNYLYERWLRTPDEYWTWRRSAIACAQQLIREKQIPLVYTSANPYTCHQIGRELQKEGVRWVADLRDPHAYNSRTVSRYPRVFARQRAIEQEAVHRADAVTATSEAIAMICTDMYGCATPERFHFITTGLDDALVPRASCATRPYPYLIYSGEYLKDYGTRFLEVFARVIRMPQVAAFNYHLLMVGRIDVNQHLRPMIKTLGLESHVEFVDHLPQRELYPLIAGAKAGIVLSAPLHQWWCLYAKMVDYIALQKPVLAMVPETSEAHTRLSRAGLGIFLDQDIDRSAEILCEFLLNREDRGKGNPEECRKYLALSQVQSFANLFESLLEGVSSMQS